MKSLNSFVNKITPLILTQLDRDPDSPTYGCFDRNFWHYKTTDFSSAILQQSVQILASLPQITPNSWLKAALNYWAKLPTKNGAFNEYYPFEGSYPATAFSLEAITNLLLNHSQLTTKKIKFQINRSIDFLLNHYEDKALNQQSAGLTALVQAKQLGYSVDLRQLKSITSKFFKSQTTEGWFPEYGGPDIGYLSVTLDMLADYHQVLKDTQSLNTAKKAIDYLSLFIRPDGTINVINNSRETEYITPYGLAYFSKFYPLSAKLYSSIFSNIDSNHFLHSIDNRYLTHYIGNSCFKADSLTKIKTLPYKLKPQEIFMPLSKTYIKIDKNNTLVITGSKGGSYQVTGKKPKVDFGVRCYQKNSTYVTNCYNPQSTIRKTGKKIIIKSPLIKAKYITPSPVKAFILRALSYLLGNKIINILKKILIFHQPNNQFTYVRKFDLVKNIVSTQTSSNDVFILKTAPKASIRHVASAFSFSQNDLVKLNNYSKGTNNYSYTNRIINNR